MKDGGRIILINEEFNSLDVSNTVIERRLALTGEEETRNFIARDEDEAFIRQFMIDRSNYQNPPTKVNCWAERTLWIQTLIEIGALQRQYWIDEARIGGVDIVTPDPERDYVEDEYTSTFKHGCHYERYLERLSVKDNEGWELDLGIIEKAPRYALCSKSAKVFGMLYADMCKMNIMAVTIKDGFEAKVTARSKVDYIYTDPANKWRENVERIEGTLKRNVNFRREDGEVMNHEIMSIYMRPSDNTDLFYTFYVTDIAKLERRVAELMDGRPDEQAAVEYREEMIDKEHTVDLEIDLSDYTYVDGCGKELDFELLDAFAFVESEERYFYKKTGKTLMYRKQYVIRVKAEGNKINIGDEIRGKVESCYLNEEAEKIILRKIMLRDIGYIADINWKTRLERE